MVEDILDQLESILSPLGIYKIEDNSIIKAELVAYAYGIDLVKEQIQKTFEEGFIQTSQDFGLSLREELMKIEPEGSINQRREKIIKRNCVIRGQWNPNRTNEILQETKLDVSVVEDFEKGRVIITFASQKDATIENLSKVLNVVRSEIPAHLEIRSNIGPITWNKIDKANKGFAYLDRLDLTFDSLENFE